MEFEGAVPPPADGERPAPPPAGGDADLGVFEERYGRDARGRLLRLLGQPCVTFAAIAEEFGVTRECVRRWHLLLMPEAARGHDRRRQCLGQRQKRRLLEEPLFAAFYHHARPHLHGARIGLVRTRDGYRKRFVRIDGRGIYIKTARRTGGGREDAGAEYLLARYGGSAELVYYRLAGSDYLLVPRLLVPARGARFHDDPSSRLYPFKNSFAALTGGWHEPIETAADNQR